MLKAVFAQCGAAVYTVEPPLKELLSVFTKRVGQVAGTYIELSSVGRDVRDRVTLTAILLQKVKGLLSASLTKASV